MYKQVGDGLQKLFFGKSGKAWRGIIDLAVDNAKLLIYDVEKDMNNPLEANPYM